MLYTKPINEITWVDIESFCNQRITEGLHLDYKRDFPRELGKTISAMANTFGGIILIGVKEDDQSKPIVPIAGINFERGLSERVWNIILSNITPIVLPEITVCTNQDDIKACVLIRINQSHQAPHAISGNEKVYLRTGNVNTPEKIANLGEIEWLQDQRNKSVTLRKDIIDNANERYKYYFKNKTGQTDIIGQLTLSICPLFPKEMLATPADLNCIYTDIRERNNSYALPLPEHRSRGIIVQNGSVLSEINNRNNSYHTELNSFGLYFYTETNLISVSDPGQDDHHILLIRESDILGHADLFLDSAEKFYSYLGYRGSLQFNASLNEIRQISFGEYWGSENQRHMTSDKNMFYTREIPRPPINEQKIDILFKLIQKTRWTFGLNIEFESFDKMLQRIRN